MISSYHEINFSYSISWDVDVTDLHGDKDVTGFQWMDSVTAVVWMRIGGAYDGINIATEFHGM